MDRKTGIILIIFTLALFALPLVGISLSGRPLSPYLSFPPTTDPAAHLPFSWPVFLLYLLPAAATIILIGFAAAHPRQRAVPPAAGPKRQLPWWGWAAAALMAIFWFLAWTRFSWLESIQRYTFLPLWLSYIALVNALDLKHSGRCPLLHQTVFFFCLFPLSALFWWFFEYLNQFVQNWHYTGVDFGPGLYVLHATLSFSTVLPAVYSTHLLIGNAGWYRRRFHGLPPKTRLTTVFLGWPALLIGCAGLIAVGIWPEALFALLWLAPLLILTSLLHLTGRPTLLSALAAGDWRPVISAALAALVCGFFWEMWNYYSLAKWVYSIPSVQRFHLFEMPLLGYLGYLPFGLLCVEAAELFRQICRRR